MKVYEIKDKTTEQFEKEFREFLKEHYESEDFDYTACVDYLMKNAAESGNQEYCEFSDYVNRQKKVSLFHYECKSNYDEQADQFYYEYKAFGEK